MQLALATEEDHGAIVELANLAYRGSGSPEVWTTEAGYIEGPRLTRYSLQQDLAEKPDAHLLVYRHGGDDLLLGTVWLEPTAHGAWYLGLLTVQPQMQNQQLGRKLLAAAETYAQVRGATRIQMTVINIRKSLIAWYERRGYAQTGELQPFPYGDDRFGKPLRDNLAFVVLEKAL